ncbi:MAG: hypothetical protein LAO08_18940 [Acidobacteriia bacterium]|nr:hypothetical protein [Terriglobia bacterium]
MKRTPLFIVLSGFLILFAGCKKQESDADAIRAGINTHLNGLKTINLSAMDMIVNSFSIQGNQAQAAVEFRPKTGAPAGAGMQINYTLEKQNGVWVVQNTQPAGGAIQHPAPGSDPHATMTPGPSGQLPNFNDLVGGASGASGAPGGSLPPGHPPLNSQGSSSAQGPSYSSQ